MSKATVVGESDTPPLPPSTSADDSDSDTSVLQSPETGPEAEPQTDQAAAVQTDFDDAPAPAVTESSDESGEGVAPDSRRASRVAAEGEEGADPESQAEVSPSSPPVTDNKPDTSEVQPLVIIESTPLAAEAGHTDQPDPGVEDGAPLSPDLSQPSDPEATSPPVPDSVQSPPHVPDPEDTPQPELDTQPVGIHKTGEVDSAPTPASEATTETARQRCGRKDCAEVAVDIEKPSPYSPGLNGSAQLTAAAADCSQLDPEEEDCTPLLTQTSRDDSQSPPASPSNSTTRNNRTTGGLRSRLQRPVKIPIPEDCLASKRMATSLEDITSLRLWKGIIAEFVGVLLLVLVGCGSCLSLDDSSSPSVVQIALCFGLSVATIVWNIGHISGGHINPAVTLALLATRKISLAKAVFFVLFQLLGAVVGAGILMGLTPTEYQGTLGSTLVSDNLDPGKGLGVEILITFVLVFTVFASIDSKRRDLNGSTPLTIGLSVAMCHLFAIQYTGASMNTARSFGPALVTGKWDNHWVYWVGPITGGVVAGLLYEYLFAVNASLTKVRACVLSSDYDDDKFRAKKIKVRIVEEDPEATTETLALTPSDGQTAIEDPYSTPVQTA